MRPILRMSTPQSITIYVGDLSPHTVETDLYRVFGSQGTITSVKIIRNPNPTTSASACYAYVNYEHADDASKAIKNLNFTELHGRQIRVMPYIPKGSKASSVLSNRTVSNQYNIIVTNLPLNVNNRLLYETFTVFGDIVTCKVAVTTDNKSRGFGFVSYKDKISLKKAIKFANGSCMNGMIIKVAKHEKKTERESKKDLIEDTFTNVYIKNFDFGEIELKKLLERFGKITSFYVPRKDDGNVKGVAFCNFEDHECALNAIKNLHNKSLENLREEYEIEKNDELVDDLMKQVSGIKIDTEYNPEEISNTNEDNMKILEPFYIQRAQLKQEREEELRGIVRKMTMNGQHFKRNLYITGIPENFSEKEIRDIFDNFGKITNILTKRDINTNKQFCYICYSKPEEASIAIEKGNELFFDDTKVSITYFKTKKERLEMKEQNQRIYSGKSNEFNGLSKNGSLEGPLFNSWAYENAMLGKKTMDKKMMGGDLYGLVLSMSGIFQEDWKKMGISDEYAFADRITKLLMEKPSNEVRNMMGLGNVLSQNITELLRDLNKNNNN